MGRKELTMQLFNDKAYNELNDFLIDIHNNLPKFKILTIRRSTIPRRVNIKHNYNDHIVEDHVNFKRTSYVNILLRIIHSKLLIRFRLIYRPDLSFRVEVH